MKWISVAPKNFPREKMHVMGRKKRYRKQAPSPKEKMYF